jgi:CubicO group peptidase (beta-lactamase class C family)
MPFAAGGLCTTLRDLARMGEMMRCDGALSGRQIMPASAVAAIRQGGSPERFAKAGYAQLPGWSYRHQWWHSHNANGMFMARGVHGQAIVIDPAAEMVVARYASHPLAANANLDPTSLPAWEALARWLMRHSA